MKTRIAIVEDDSGIAEELKHLVAEDPDFECVGVCRNLQTALREIPRWSADVIIMDINLPDGSGIDGTQILKRELPQVQIMIFTIYDEAEEIFRALAAGASGYLLKETAPDGLLRGIREIMQGGVPMTGEVARKVIQSFRRPADPDDATLTAREEEILQLLSKGYVTKEIADQLSIGLQTVKSHLKHIYAKLHVRTRTEAVIKFLR